MMAGLKTHYKVLLSFSAAALFVFIVGSRSASAAFPKPQDIRVLNVTAGGNGCPQGTYSVLITASRPGGPADFFEVIFDQFIVEKGPGVRFSERRKNCTVAVDLYIPNGIRFTLTSVHYEGYGLIPKYESGRLTTEYFFPFFSNRVSTNRTLYGPFNGNYQKQDTIGLFSVVWSPCGLKIPLNMKSTLLLNGPQNTFALMTVDQQTGLLRQKWAIQWAYCGP